MTTHYLFFSHCLSNGLIRGLLFYFILSAGMLTAQTPGDSLRNTLTISVEARFATTDNLGNLYLITKQNSIEKYSSDGNFLARYTNNRLGAATRLDVTNPMKIFIWYADFRTVVFLNRSLTLLGKLNLIDAGYPEVQTLAAAADGNLWLYDEVAFQLIKITPEGVRRFESQALNLVQTERITINTIRDNSKEVLASDPQKGLLRFDTYGQFSNLLPKQGVSSFVLTQDQVIHHSNERLHFDQLKGFGAYSLPLPGTAMQKEAQCWLSPKGLLVQYQQLLNVWTWQK